MMLYSTFPQPQFLYKNPNLIFCGHIMTGEGRQKNRQASKRTASAPHQSPAWKAGHGYMAPSGVTNAPGNK